MEFKNGKWVGAFEAVDKEEKTYTFKDFNTKYREILTAFSANNFPNFTDLFKKMRELQEIITYLLKFEKTYNED